MTNRTRHAHDNINSHLVWCPKYRRPVLAGDVGRRLSELIPPIVEELEGHVLTMTVQDDHLPRFPQRWQLTQSCTDCERNSHT